MKRNEEAIYMRYHTMGYCFSDCRYSSGHGGLTEDEKSKLNKFLTGVRSGRKAFLDGKRGGFKKKGGEKPPMSTQG